MNTHRPCQRAGLATFAWRIDNNLSERQCLPALIQIATAKAAGAAVPMLLLALLVIGALSCGICIELDLLALRDLGTAREAVLFSTAPFVGELFSLVVLQN